MCVFFQAEDGIRDLVRSRGLGDVYKRQVLESRPDSLLDRRKIEFEDFVKFELLLEIDALDLSLIHI